MRRITISIFLLVLSLLTCASVSAGSFVPKQYSLSYLGVTSKSSFGISMTELFDYPDDITLETNLDNLGVVVEITSSNADMIGFNKYEYYNYGKSNYVYLWKYPNQLGQADVQVKITYNSEEVINTLHFESVPFIAKSATYDVILNESDPSSLVINLLGTSSFMVSSERNNAEFTIDEAPKYGTISIVDETPRKVLYTVNEGVANYTVDGFKYSIKNSSGFSSSATTTLNIHKNSYISKVFEFLPAPGQFTNEGIAQSSSKDRIIGEKGTMISLGGFGGYVIFGFDQPITNNPQNPYGVDFSIKGNAFAAAQGGVWTEPAAVMVMKDLNGDGLPNDGDWYELAGSDYWLNTTKRNVKITYYNPHYNDRYTIPWSTDQNENGALLSNAFHKHPYYPDPFDFGCDRDSLTYEGNMILSSLNMSKPNYITFYKPPVFGYADSRGNSANLTKPQNPYYKDENGNAADGFDLSWAVDRDGNHVDLDEVHFVKVYTAGNANAGWLGEWSSEVLAAGITTPDPNYVPKDYYFNYIGITQLKVLKGQSCQFQGILFKNGIPSEEGTPKWRVEDPSIGTVDQSGVFTAVGNGKTWLYYSQKDDIAEDAVEVIVSELESVILELEGNTNSPDSVSMIVGEKIYITAQSVDNYTTANRFTYDSYNWTTSNPEIGTIENGLFTATKVGETMLHAYSKNNPELFDNIKVRVNEIPEVSIINNPIVLKKENLTGSLNVTSLFRTSTNSTIYLEQVSSDNDETEVGIEKNVFNYSFNGDKIINDIVSFEVTSYNKRLSLDVNFVYEPLFAVESIHLSESEITVDAGSSYQLTAVVKPDYATNKNVAWSSSDNDIAKVSDSGLVSGVAVGEATITATTQDGGLTATCIVKVVGTSTGVDNGTVDNNSIHFEKATGLVVINSSADGVAAIYSLTGNLVSQAAINAGTNKISTAGLANGLYIVQYEGKTLKFVK